MTDGLSKKQPESKPRLEKAGCLQVTEFSSQHKDMERPGLEKWQFPKEVV